jgi:hypothetical protein
MAVAGLMEWGRSRLSYEFEENELALGTIPSLDNIQLSEKPYRIGIQQTPCHFGGSRKWFVCPTCEGRVGVVYLEDGKFACRKCCDLAYHSNLESRIDRLISKAFKLRHRLGCSGNLTSPVPDKPVGMHYRTYWRTIQKLIQTEKAIAEAAFDEIYK